MLAPARPARTGGGAPAVSDFIDFSVYVDAAPADIRRWYVERFRRLRETAFRDPASYFRRFAALEEQEAVTRAEEIWAEINGPNLEQNIAPTRGRASLVLRKGDDHRVTGIRLRKVCTDRDSGCLGPAAPRFRRQRLIRGRICCSGGPGPDAAPARTGLAPWDR